jgi:crotonobetainyl-CoA:carnitine CoA-transferase CaiB-like acyl-CoA transferase
MLVLYEAVSMMRALCRSTTVTASARITGGALPGIVPSNTYTCADGAAIVVAATGMRYLRLMAAMGRTDLGDDPALARNEGRVRRTAEIDEAIQSWCSGRSIDEALAALKAADVPASRIYSVADMFGDPQFAARGMIEQQQLPDGTAVKVPSVVPKLSATPGGTAWLGPRLGEHTGEILSRFWVGAPISRRSGATAFLRSRRGERIALTLQTWESLMLSSATRCPGCRLSCHITFALVPQENKKVTIAVGGKNPSTTCRYGG